MANARRPCGTVTSASFRELRGREGAGGPLPQGDSLPSSTAAAGDLRCVPRMTLSLSRFLVFLLASALLGGCLSPRTRGPAATTPVQLVDLNPVLAPGTTALLAASVVATDEGPSLPPTRLTLRLGDREIPARLYWAWAQVPGAGLRATWLEPPLRWRLTLEPPAGGAFRQPPDHRGYPARWAARVAAGGRHPRAPHLAGGGRRAVVA